MGVGIPGCVSRLGKDGFFVGEARGDDAPGHHILTHVFRN